ncbi:hypothetical protein F2P56_011312 [Juglans regia]|uniref:ABSCISIC ACID-INSENSITIVE 5-like protein 2 n=2 Tax=Juglans regia TaxID=51240 RepID=A0A2I4FH70_JUGRE|nr:ABSCISIC ACID-INSENSITIVE 5-like protein 2 [Juglans regia]XP_018831016.1 ABSCISIC ACID-INSENSITIVE 5-like protein 2 [Juglans regia]XP_035546384.1 ABSCISIC ACID-INSENSITIVE 5-like protein 2 [Juglans regia]KAF5470823.1 hypothetical protein F2P56_011312 [Juglans regia]
MGIQTMGSQGNGQQPHLQPSPLTRQSSWYNLTLNEVKNQLGDMGKPVGSMNLDELLQKVWAAEANQSMEMDNDNSSSASSFQREASATLARALSGKTVDQVWTEIQQGRNKRYGEGPKGQDSNMKLGETTLEDFLVQAGLFAQAFVGPTMGLDIVEAVTPQNFPQKMGLSSSPSTCSLSDTTAPGWKRTASDTFEKTLDRRLKRKIKNRESAARSRARKQAYHNELVSKVSHLEEENIKLKKEKEFDKMLPRESSPETKYQLRRTSSASF